jgi:hypothetical protein
MKPYRHAVFQDYNACGWPRMGFSYIVIVLYQNSVNHFIKSLISVMNRKDIHSMDICKNINFIGTRNLNLLGIRMNVTFVHPTILINCNRNTISSYCPEQLDVWMGK